MPTVSEAAIQGTARRAGNTCVCVWGEGREQRESDFRDGI